MTVRSTCGIIGTLAIAGLAISPAVSQEAGLFSGHDAVSMRLTVDIDSLCRPREDENCTFSPATLAYETADGEERTLPIEVRVRGGWRAIRENCEVPPLFVVFPSGSADGDLFAGQEVLPLRLIV